MEIERRILKNGAVRWRVRWRQGGRRRSQAFDRKGDAVTFSAELRRRQQLGTLTEMDMGRVTLADYVVGTWCEAYASQLSPKTWMHYRQLLNKHILPSLGPLELRAIRPETIARWQAQRLAAGHGRVSVRYALTLLGAILQRAFENGQIQSNPARAVRKAALPRRTEVRPLAPATIERMRAASSPRDATLISVLAYAGLRPGEALALQWRDIREQTILVERAISLGEEKDTKTAAHRTVRVLQPLAVDLREWRLRSGRPCESIADLPVGGRDALDARRVPVVAPTGVQARHRGAGLEHGRPYDLRHSFASLLLHEGRSVIYVARQLGHDARLTLSTYGHVMDEFEDMPRLDAQTVIADARAALAAAASSS